MLHIVRVHWNRFVTYISKYWFFMRCHNYPLRKKSDVAIFSIFVDDITSICCCGILVDDLIVSVYSKFLLSIYTNTKDPYKAMSFTSL